MLRIPSAVLAAVVLLTTPAWAGTALLHDASVDAATARARAEAALPDATIDASATLDSLFDVEPGTAIAVGAPFVRCTAEVKRTLRGELLQVDQAMTDMEYRAASAVIDTIVARIACYAADASREDLYELFFTQGMAAFFAGDTARAQDAFSQATAIDPSRPWPREFPPTAKPLYDEALRLMTASPPARVADAVPGDVHVDGRRDYGNPRLYPGGHLVFVPGSTSSLWVTIPRMPPLSPDGLIIATAADVRAGVLAGDDRFGPWLVQASEAEGWTEIVVVTTDAVMLFRGGSFYTPEGIAIPRPTARLGGAPPPPPAGVAGLVFVGVGAGMLVGGLGLNVTSYEQGIPKLGGLLPPRAEYATYKRQNTIGLVLAGVGSGLAGVGLTMAILGFAQPRGPRGRLAALPWATGDAQGLHVGVTGSLP